MVRLYFGVDCLSAAFIRLHSRTTHLFFLGTFLIVLEQARQIGGLAVERATSRLAGTYAALRESGVADRVQLDLGLLRDLGYYTGAILEVYDPALGQIIGGGGRYDRLAGRYGRELPAAGFALYVERVHIAQAEEERLAREETER